MYLYSQRSFSPLVLRRYETLLTKARLEDLTDIASLRCLYRSGVDRHGRPVIVFVGKNFCARDTDIHRVCKHGYTLYPPPTTTPPSGVTLCLSLFKRGTSEFCFKRGEM